MNNILKNLPPFYIGQKVVYITGNNMPKDSIHIVTEINRKECGCYYINIDNKIIEQDIPKHVTHVGCSNCNFTRIKNDTDKQRGWNIKSFRALEQKSFPLIKFEQIEINEFLKKESEILISN